MTPKDRCKECDCFIREEKDGIYICYNCGNPISIAEKPEE